MRAGVSALAPSGRSLRDRVGICQWFHFQDYPAVERTIRLMQQVGAIHLRTGISWADYYRPGGAEWYEWQMNRLANSGLTTLLSVWHTPPSISDGGSCNSPPRRLRDYADFIDLVIRKFGGCFDALELWNEPNNRFKWDFPRHDPDWSKFAAMVGDAGYWARQCGKQTVLGGLIPVDRHWLAMMRDYGVLEQIDVVAIHAFPGMWFPNHPNWDWCDRWNGWEQKLAELRPIAGSKPIWVTETGLSTWDLAVLREGKFELQAQCLEAAANSPAERLYWYSLIDLDPAREAIEGFHVDENEYHMGLVTHDGRRKPAFALMQRLLAEAKISPSHTASLEDGS